MPCIYLEYTVLNHYIIILIVFFHHKKYYERISTKYLMNSYENLFGISLAHIMSIAMVLLFDIKTISVAYCIYYH